MAREQAAKWMRPGDLVPWEKNPRKNQAVQKVADSIEAFGFGAPIVARKEDLRVIAGHTRLKAALQLELERVPVRLLDVTEEQADALSIADNRLTELADWNTDGLRELVQEMDDPLTKLLGWSERNLERMTEELATGLSTDPVALDQSWEIVIKCESEEHQLKLLERFAEEGLECHALSL